MFFLNFCTPIHEDFIEKLPEYEDNDWEGLQICLKSHYTSEDHAQYAGNRAYLESFVQQCNVRPLDFMNYYAEFLAIVNACVERGQIHKEEQGWYFFKGLSKEDQSLVMFNMPESDRPVGDTTSSFNFQKMFKFLQEMDKQRQSIVNCSAAHRAVNAQRAKEAYQHSKQGPSGSVQDIVRSIIDQNTKEKKEEPLPENVDPELDEIIKGIESFTLTMDQFSSFTQHPTVEKWFRKPANVTYAIGKILVKEPPSNHRNDDSYVSNKPKNVSFADGTRTINGREYDNRCLMCAGTDGHRVRECTAWQEVQANGWAFSIQVREDSRKSWEYHFGQFNQDLGVMPGKAPFSFILDWIRTKCCEFYNITNTDFAQRAKDVCPDKFAKKVPAQSISQQGQSTNTITLSTRPMSCVNLEADFLKFNNWIKTNGPHQDVYYLDATDREYLILNKSLTVNTATRSQKEALAKPLPPPVHKARVQKSADTTKKCSPPDVTSRFRHVRDFGTHPSMRRGSSGEEPSVDQDMPDAPRESFSPTPSTLGWDVRPEDINTPNQ